MKACPYCAEEIQDVAVKCKHCGEFLDAGPAVPHQAGGGYRRVTLSRSDSMFAGVCGGVAKHLGMDPTIVRIVVALAVIFTGIIPGIIAYVVMAFIIPDEAAR